MNPTKFLLPIPVKFYIFFDYMIFFLGMSIRKLIKDGLVMKRSTTIHSRSRARRHAESKRRGILIVQTSLLK